MKVFLVIAIAIALVGCARRYKVTLTNGNSFTTLSKPRLNEEGTAYIYKDRNGKETWVSSGRVTEIARE